MKKTLLISAFISGLFFNNAFAAYSSNEAAEMCKTFHNKLINLEKRQPYYSENCKSLLEKAAIQMNTASILYKEERGNPKYHLLTAQRSLHHTSLLRDSDRCLHEHEILTLMHDISGLIRSV